VLVYDLGGGTFDVSLVKLGKKRFQVLGIEGDVQLGGKDWDDRLIDHVAAEFQRSHGGDPRADPQSLAMLRASAERAKRTLSKIDRASVTCAHGGTKVQVPITRQEFEALTGDLLLRTRVTTLEVLDTAGVNPADVSKILMVGGSTHMPGCAAMLRTLFGREPDRSLAVSEVVARGAALHAGIHAAKAARAAGRDADPGAGGDLANVVEISVNAHSLGVEIRAGADRQNDKLIAKNTQLPAAASRVYRTAKPNQTKVRVRVLQGESGQAAACIPVGECWIDGLPRDLPLGSPVQVHCRVAENGRIEVTALDMTSGRLARAEIHRQGGLTPEALAAEAAYVRGLEVQ
jgi:molecular chaperone DnaK